MNNWQVDLFTGLQQANSMQNVLDIALKTVQPMGFNFCSWRARLSLPVHTPKSIVLKTSEDKVLQKVANGDYDSTPAYQHCSRSMTPFAWEGTTEDKVFAQIPDICEEYYSLGHRAGWAQSLVENHRMYSIFWAESSDAFTTQYIEEIDYQMQWIATASLSRMNQLREKPEITLSLREQEILRWTGDGKTADQIAEILMLSPSTINFHLRNAMMKLDAPNKTAAVVRAIFLGLLR